MPGFIPGGRGGDNEEEQEDTDEKSAAHTLILSL
jgi:hypothetical protein